MAECKLSAESPGQRLHLGGVKVGNEAGCGDSFLIFGVCLGAKPEFGACFAKCKMSGCPASWSVLFQLRFVL